jgi:ubiquinone/menaquinone biosynthesis C-methylase UbiE
VEKYRIHQPTKRDIRHYYDTEYHPRAILNRKSGRDYRLFIRSIRGIITPGMKILDVGCGTGFLMKAAEDEGIVSVGIDISQNALFQSRLNSPSSRLVQGDGEHLPFKSRSFHCVVGYGSLEHFEYPENGIVQISRVMRDGGLLRISVPNSRFWPRKVGLFRGTGQIIEESLTLEEWTRMLITHGFSVVSVKKDFGPPIFKNFKVLGMIERVLLKLSCLAPLRYNYQFVFTMKKGRE